VAKKFITSKGLDEDLIDSLQDNIIYFLKNFDKRAQKKQNSSQKIFNPDERKSEM